MFASRRRKARLACLERRVGGDDGPTCDLGVDLDDADGQDVLDVIRQLRQRTARPVSIALSLNEAGHRQRDGTRWTPLAVARLCARLDQLTERNNQPVAYRSNRISHTVVEERPMDV